MFVLLIPCKVTSLFVYIACTLACIQRDNLWLYGLQKTTCIMKTGTDVVIIL